jgi:[methyl-Co(III) methanol-specific corrinoid protein]:coenzyme M methyltransferase
MTSLNERESLLELLNGHRLAHAPAFSGLIHITAEGLQSEGLNSYEIHQNAQKMAKAAASTFRLTGMPSAALPLDLCAPAEALGAELRFYVDEFRFPQVGQVKFESTQEITEAAVDGGPILDRGRLKIICEAFGLAKQDIGSQAVLSGIIPGAFTLLLYACSPKNVFIELKKDPDAPRDALVVLASFLKEIGHAYLEAGADFITIHEMGGSPGFLGPSRFEQFVLPPLQNMIAALPAPTVLSVCGNTNKSMHVLAQSGANAISVDQMNDLAASRRALTDCLLFGNLDPVHTISGGTLDQIRNEVQSNINAGVDAVWPGCDLVPETPLENIKAFIAA